MSTQNKTAINTKQRQRSGFLQHFFIFVVVCIFAVIITKNISIPQTVIRPIGVIVLTFLFYAAFFRPTIPFLALVVYMPFSRVLVGDFGTYATGFNLTNILMFIVAFGWILVSISSQKRIFKKSILNPVILAFIFWGFITLIRSTYFYGSEYLDSFMIPLKRWLTPILLYFIALNMVKDKQTLKKVVIAMMLVTLIISVMAIYDYSFVANSGNLDKSRVGGVFEQPNTLGGFFVYTMFLFLGFFLAYFPNLKYMLLLIPFLITFRGIMVTFSRGAYIGCAFGGMAITFFKSKFLFVGVLSLLIIGLFNPAILPSGIRNRMGSTFYGEKVISADLQEIKDESASNRINIWKGAVAMIKDEPIFGYGYGTFPYIIGNYAPNLPSIDAHNTYLIVAAEMGIPALLIFLLIIFIMIKNARWLYLKSKDKFVRAFALGMLGCLFGLVMVNMFGSRLNSEEVGAYFWIYAGLIMAAVNMKKRELIR